MKKYAIFTASTFNYINYLNAQINSIYKRGLHKECDLTFYLFWNDNQEFTWDKKYFDDIKERFPFKIETIEIKPNEIEMGPSNPREYIKRARYNKIMEYAVDYDAVCLLDADMFMVSDRFMCLFDLVSGTDKLIGCNERFKWGVDNYYYNGEKMFKPGTKLLNMICNVPAIFDMKKWKHVFERYVDFVENATQDKHNNGVRVGLGDLYCWNTAIQYENRQKDVIVFPMETMAQVHHTYVNEWCYHLVDKDYWYTFAGDRVYSVHGRIAQTNFVDGNLKLLMKNFSDRIKDKELLTKIYNQQAGRMRPGLEKIQKEWYDLNFNVKTVLADYINVDIDLINLIKGYKQ